MRFGVEHVKRDQESDGTDRHHCPDAVLILGSTGRPSRPEPSSPLIYGQHGADYLIVASIGVLERS